MRPREWYRQLRQEGQVSIPGVEASKVVSGMRWLAKCDGLLIVQGAVRKGPSEPIVLHLVQPARPTVIVRPDAARVDQ